MASPERKTRMNHRSLFDERKCPVCGKRFILRCKPWEWGCVAQGGEYGRKNSRILLCSIPCMKEYARKTFEKSAEKVMKMRAWEAWRLVNIEKVAMPDVAKIMGITLSQVGQYAGQIDLFYWQEAEWLANRERMLSYGRV